MSLSQLMPPDAVQAFLRDNFQRQPYAAVAGATACAALASWETFRDAALAEHADLMIVRRNRVAAESRPINEAELQRVLEGGNTVLIRHAERHSPELARFAAELACDFAADVNLHLYCTPGSEQGFGWHYDAEEVFLIQGRGRKEYSLRKNTVNPWPIEETLPADMHYERELMPLMRCLLAPGDWLYIPSGYWHFGAAKEFSITLAAGVRPLTALDLFDYARKSLCESLLWRQRLPVFGKVCTSSDSESSEKLSRIADDLIQDFAAVLRDPKWLESFVKSNRDKHTP